MKLRDLLELARVSNLPTVWSNVWMGWLVGNVAYHMINMGDISIAGVFSTPVHTIAIGLLAAFSMSLIYSGGMVMNDLLDREVDAIERPTRPIPSGRVSSKAALKLVVLLLAGGFVSMSLTAWVAGTSGLGLAPPAAVLLTLALILTLTAYNRWHQRSALAMLLMASCRGLLIVACAGLAFTPLAGERASMPNIHTVFWLLSASSAVLVFGYTQLISIVARAEAASGRRRWFSSPKIVMNMIAAFPLIDAGILILFHLWPASLVCVACAVLTKLGHRRIAGS